MAKKSYNAGEANPRYKDGRYGAFKMTLRLPEDVNQILEDLAKAQGISKTEVVVRMLRAAEKGDK